MQLSALNMLDLMLSGMLTGSLVIYSNSSSYSGLVAIDSTHFDHLSGISSILVQLEASADVRISKLANELRIDIATRHRRDSKPHSGWKSVIAFMNLIVTSSS